ncbi:MULTISPECIES: transglutaminase family protein [Mesorhizobium]|uniref:Transglutaminase family protein n=1 Tax=Mesorhizobium denitrificans TaxID=2294114 RepID=A0A371XDK4_9HYPH|nr:MULTISPECIES: transglutaminase family protein [Mesorhizobium]RFC67310.1 transglutaminase family protein [Mesorhizobium denitrificans]
MLLKISHRTEYSYDSPVNYALQRLRLVPRTGPTQKVISWAVEVEGARNEVRFKDQFDNETRLVSAHGAPHVISIVAEGTVETHDKSGIYGRDNSLAPLWLFETETDLTAAGPGVRKLIKSIKAAGEIDRLHELMQTISQQVAYNIGATGPETTAEQALAQGSGVCQDHAHVFIAAARLMGYPARYVSGYLMMDDQVEQVASHAWAEANVDGLGWVTFDAANGISTDERYVRIAVGRDYRDAMPVSGIRLGVADERLAVRITVEQ